jgi:hypothetical protein
MKDSARTRRWCTCGHPRAVPGGPCVNLDCAEHKLYEARRRVTRVWWVALAVVLLGACALAVL